MKSGYRIALIIWTILMITLSSIPGLATPPIQHQQKIADKVVHVIEYAIWAFFFLSMLKQEKRIQNAWGTFVTAILLGILLGIFDEIHQGFVPGRERDLFDLFADLIGLAFTATIFCIIYQIKNRRLVKRTIRRNENQ